MSISTCSTGRQNESKWVEHTPTSSCPILCSGALKAFHKLIPSQWNPKSTASASLLMRVIPNRYWCAERSSCQSEYVESYIEHIRPLSRTWFQFTPPPGITSTSNLTVHFHQSWGNIMLKSVRSRYSEKPSKINWRSWEFASEYLNLFMEY